MAAPDNIIWGPEANAGEYPGKLGIYSIITTTATSVNIELQVWIWTKESCKDSGNKLYFDVAAGITEATTDVGSVSVDTHSNTNWSENNKQHIYTTTQLFTRGKIDYAYNVRAKLTGVEYGGGETIVATTITVPRLDSYIITYNANGGTRAPSSQTKYHGQPLVLTVNKPSRTGYTFAGWATSASGSVKYSSGATYSTDANLTLYAVWTSNAITITFDSNGGDTDPPSPITTSYNKDVDLPYYTPSKTYYNFLGWAKTSSATVPDYTVPGTISGTTNMTLYAVWEKAYEPPLIYNLKVDRCSSDGTLTDEGRYARVSFNWECSTEFRDSYPIDEIYIAYAGEGSNSWTTSYYSYPNTLTGSVNEVIGEGNLDPDNEYDISIAIGDTITYLEFYRRIDSQRFPIDVLKGGKGVSFGCPATDEGVAKFAYSLLINRGDGKYKKLIDLIHPIGSVITLYPKPEDLKGGKLTEDCDIHPKKQYPGTEWERINEKFLWATSDGGTIGTTGGSSTKTLTVANLPAHTHGSTYSGNVATDKKKYAWFSTSSGTAMGYDVVSTGSGTAFDIMPPYVQVAMFRRVS